MEMANFNDTLDWDVTTTNLIAIGPSGQLLTVPGKKAHYRNDTNEVIGVTGTSYNVFQNSSLKAMIAPAVEEGILEIENMGVIKNGAKVFIQAKMAENFTVAGEETKGMISLLNAHDGTAALAAGVTTERVICSNTFASAMTDMDSRLRHGRDINDKARDIKAIVNFIDEGMTKYRQAVELLDSTWLNDMILDDIICNAYGQKDVSSVRAANSIRRFCREGKGNNGKTLWDAVNGVTEYLTHESQKDSSKRFISTNFGRNALIARRAMNVALAIAS